MYDESKNQFISIREIVVVNESRTSRTINATNANA